MIDQKDESNNVYLAKQNLHKKFTVQFKSILLDFVERYKTIERVSEATGWTTIQVMGLVDNLVLKFRKFYNIADIKSFDQFNHMHYVHMY